MSSAKSRLCVRLMANLALAVAIPAAAMTLFAGYKSLSESTDKIARANTKGCVSEEARQRKLIALLDKAIENSRAKDVLIKRLLCFLAVAYAILLLASARNVGTTANCRRTGLYGPVRLQSQQF